MRDIIKSISQREWHYVLLVTSILIVITTLPHIINKITTPSNLYYWTGSGDLYVYYSMIDQAKEGHLLFENKFTSEPQRPALFHPLWLMMGVVASLFNLSNFAIWHIARVALIILLVLSGYIFIAYLFPDAKKRIIALFLFAFSSGIITPFAESTVFSSVLYSPLLILSLIIIILTFLFVLLALEKKSKYGFYLAGLLALLQVIVHPYDLATVWAVLFFFFSVLIFLRKYSFTKLLQGFLTVILISGLGLLYYYYIFTEETALGGWARQNILHSPNLLAYLPIFGLLWPLAIYGIYYYFIVLKKTELKFIFILMWFCVSSFLLYAPLQFNLKLMLGLQLPMIIFSVFTICQIYSKYIIKISKKFLRNLSIILISLILSVNSIYWLLTTTSFQLKPDDYYLPKKIVEGFHLLRKIGNPEEVILSSPKWNTILGGETGKRVFISSAHNTVNFYQKEAQVKLFFHDNKDDEAKTEFLKENSIDYIIYTKLEKNLGRYNPAEKDYLKNIYQNEYLTIYQVE